jgi:uncharacterized protein (DUF1800 family)
MSANVEKRENANRAVSYPVIYSYIYERETEDIKRLAKSFKTPPSINPDTPKNKAIVGFKIENGAAIAVYAKSNKAKRDKRTSSDKPNVIVWKRRNPEEEKVTFAFGARSPKAKSQSPKSKGS